NRIQLELVYACDLYDEDRVATALADLEELLAGMVSAPDHSVFAVSFVLPGSPLAMLGRSPLDVGPRSVAALHDPVVRHARGHPDATALVDPRQSVTYAALDAASRALGSELVARGIRQGDVVAILADRSAALAGAMIAVLRAGAAFVALDPRYPGARLTRYV